MRYAVILAGGKGERFWPKSRGNLPKQLLSFGSGQSMLAAAVNRVRMLIPDERIIILASREVYDKLIEIEDFQNFEIVAEPESKNTAPPLALAAQILQNRDMNASMAVLPSDHFIREDDLFCQTLEAGFNLAEKESKLVTFGITPTRPETGYGYIELGDKIPGFSHAFLAERFREKPNLATAFHFIKKNKFLWNSGMFVWQAGTLLDEFKIHQSEIFSLLQTFTGGDFDKPKMKQFFQEVKKISIDYAIMETSENVSVIQANFHWDDVGSWTSLERIYEPDGENNVFLGNVLSQETTNCIASADHGIIALHGLNGLIVVKEKDAVLVIPKDKSQEVRQVVQGLANIEEWKKFL